MRFKNIFILFFILLIFTSPAYSENSKYLPPVPVELLTPKNNNVSKDIISEDIINNHIVFVTPTPTSVPLKKKETEIKIPAKKVSGGILVREDVFNDLVKTKKESVLLKEENIHYKEKASYFQSKYEELYQKSSELNDIQNERLKLKDEIIQAKNEKLDLLEYQLGNYKDLNKKTEQELKASKSKNFFLNLISTGAFIYGASKTEDDGAKATMIGAALLQIKW